MCQSLPDDELTEPGRLRGQEHAGNAREGGEAGPWYAATQLAPFGLLGLILAGFCIFFFLTSSQFTHVAGLGLLSPALVPHLLEARDEHTCWSEGSHANLLLVEVVDIWVQWG